jgi:5-methylcytosine-specific restriction endonuclease McrA
MLTKQELKIHESALLNAAKSRRAEVAMLKTVIEVDELKLFRKFDLPSTYAYCQSILDLSEPETCNLINVARKAREIPELLEAIEAEDLRIAKARKIVPVITKDNAAQWIKKALTLSYKALEKEVAYLKPQAAKPDRVKHTGPGWMRLQANITEETWAKFQHVQDLLGTPNYNDVLDKVLSGYIKKHDPLKKAERAKHDRRTRVTRQGRAPIPKSVQHAVNLRDQRKCQKCTSKRYLQFHHIQEVARGGLNTADNITTLCSSCHRGLHLRTTAVQL